MCNCACMCMYVADLHLYTILWQIHTHFPKHFITPISCYNSPLPARYAFKSSPLPFIDSNLRIVLEFWHLLILNLLTPGRHELNITPGVYLNNYKKPPNIPKTPWIVPIHAHKRDWMCNALSTGPVTHQNISIRMWRCEAMYLGESFDRWFHQHFSWHRSRTLLSLCTGSWRVQTANCMWVPAPVRVRLKEVHLKNSIQCILMVCRLWTLICSDS